MSNSKLRLRLGRRHSLRVNLADRSDVDRSVPGGGVLDTAIDTANGFQWTSGPFKQATEISGLYSGKLVFTVNKKDFDLEIDLYELDNRGHFFQLAPWWTRASSRKIRRAGEG
jgi:hypothetical protein